MKQFDFNNLQFKGELIERTYRCSECNDTGFKMERRQRVNSHGQAQVNRNGDPIYDEFAARCQCEEQAMMVNRAKWAMLPDEFKGAKFNTYKQTSTVQTDMYRAIGEWLSGIPPKQKLLPDEENKRRLHYPSFGFIAKVGELKINSVANAAQRMELKKQHNSYGLGKTHLTIAAAKHLIKLGYHVLVVSDPVLMTEAMSAKSASDGGNKFDSIIDKIARADVLVWDDIGKSKHSEAREQFYYQIINQYYQAKKPILFTSNEDTDTLGEKLGNAALSRLIGMTERQLHAVEGRDYRIYGDRDNEQTSLAV